VRRDLVRIAKWTAIIVGSLLLLLAAAVLVITSVVDPNRYRGKVEGIVGDLTGRRLVIEGNLKITWFPWLGVQVGPAHLDDRADGPPMSEVAGGAGGTAAGPLREPRPPFIEWESLSVAAKLLPLLKGQVVVDRVRLEGPHFRLHRDSQGHGNWEGLGPRSISTSSARRGAPPPEIAGIEIRNGTLEYVDEAIEARIELSGLEVEVGEWRAGQPLPLNVKFILHGGSLPPSGLSVRADAAALSVRLEPLNVTAPKLAIKVADAAIEGALIYKQSTTGEPSAQGSIAAKVPSVRKLAADLAVNQTLPHDPTTLGPLELTTSWSYANGSLSARPLVVKLDGVKLEGWVQREVGNTRSGGVGQAGNTRGGSGQRSGAWRFELHGDRIDLGRYFDVDGTSKKPFELTMLRDIDANGTLIFDEAQFADTRMSDVRLRLRTSEGTNTPEASQ